MDKARSYINSILNKDAGMVIELTSFMLERCVRFVNTVGTRRDVQRFTKDEDWALLHHLTTQLEVRISEINAGIPSQAHNPSRHTHTAGGGGLDPSPRYRCICTTDFSSCECRVREVLGLPKRSMSAKSFHHTGSYGGGGGGKPMSPMKRPVSPIKGTASTPPPQHVYRQTS
eukprot:PhF_6_TR41340/c0_g1_i2/m.62717